jgi:two-component system, NtrC family, nitrogen regulation sensor histidine kinase NtrY
MASRPSQGRPTSGTKGNGGISFEARFRIFCTILGLLLLSMAGGLLALEHLPGSVLAGTLLILALVLGFVFTAFYEAAVRPVQTLSNVVSALREEDYSFRARGASRNDALGELAREINALADTLQTHRVKALEAAALLQRVMNEMDAPVLAFDQDGALQLLNPAAERAFGLHTTRDMEKSAAELGVTSLLRESNEAVIQVERQGRPVRWMIRRSRFRQRGFPHTLVVLSDVSAALREEEQTAWQRLIRVLGHEISNSLAPIKSIAGSLRVRLGSEEAGADVSRGLAVIENRADSLHRFVQSYRELAQLPPPVRHAVYLPDLLARVVPLETRVPVRLQPPPEVTLMADPDQLEQLLINLVRNAAEAANEGSGGNVTAEVTISARPQNGYISVVIEDNGPGIANPTNLFVPFYTTKKSGTGVGLALARQIAEAHGGSIELRNRVGAIGCQAEVKLPTQLLGPDPPASSNSPAD